jgi:hypothetical protein
MANPYNGFTPEQRDAAYYWAKAEERAGRRRRPTSCDACGQTEGLLQRHSEDYSAPYGPHIGAIGFCYRCHMMTHCRFKRPALWAEYCDAIAAGWVFEPVHTMSLGRALVLDYRTATRRDPPRELVLDTIASGGATSPSTPRRFDVPVVLNDASRRPMRITQGLFA